MEFRPFWELLEELGIDLPNPARIQRNEQNSSLPGRESGQFRSRDEALRMLGVLLEECTTSGRNAWFPPGKTAKIDQYTIPGMVYVGDGLMSIRRYDQVEPCLIRPKLKVQCPRPDYEGKQMHYYPSYTQMKPASRAAYLEWLAGGRRDPNAHISYVWLFFYGLERRVFHDLLSVDLSANAALLEEFNEIITEVEQLLEIYGDRNNGISGPFGYKASVFVDICRVMQSQEPLCERMNPAEVKLLPLQIALGQKVKQNQPIPAAWAIAWAKQIGRKQLRQPALRCPDEFETLFRLRYAQQYGEGIRLAPKPATLKVEYYPANHSFGRSLQIDLNDLPDVTQFPSEVRQIGDLIETCTIALEPLSRLLGRNPLVRNTTAAITLLPPDLLITHGGELVHRFRRWLEPEFAQTSIVTVSGQKLFEYWSGSNPEKLSKTEAIALSQFLERLGYGMEPDPRLGSTVPTLKSRIALFRLSATNSEPLSSAYFDATLLVHLAIAVANGDDSPSLIEQHYLSSNLPFIIALPELEKIRLYAHIQLLLTEKPKLRNLKTRIEQTKPEQRERFARFLVQVAAADGQLNPKEVQLLEKVYTLLGLDAQTVYSDIHDLCTTTSDVTVRQSSHEGLNMALVNSKLKESQEISNLLAEIFVDEDTNSQAVAPPKPQTCLIAGLDQAHSEFLLALTQQSVWQREELSAIASQFNLMLDGALEVVNELAFDRVDEPLTEGDDSIEINADVLRELLNEFD